MKLNVLYAAVMVLVVASIAMGQCGGDWGCGQSSCQPCHFASHPCLGGDCTACGDPCATLQALSPAARRALHAKQVMDVVANPARLTEAGELWMQITHRRGLLNTMGRAEGANLPPGHPPIGASIAAKQKCSISQEAQLVRLDFTKYR